MRSLSQSGESSVLASAAQVMAELEAAIAALRSDDVSGLQLAVGKQNRACLQMKILFESCDRSTAGESSEAVMLAMRELRKLLCRYRAVLQHSSESIYAIASVCRLHGGLMGGDELQISLQG